VRTRRKKGFLTSALITVRRNMDAGVPPEADAVGDDDCALCVGARVKLHSLQQKPEHNGAEGEVLEFNASHALAAVQLHPDGLVLALKASNLTVLARTQQTPALVELMSGAHVEIHSLLRSPELNGVRGKIVEPKGSHSSRWVVKIDVDGRDVALKPANLGRLCDNAECRQALSLWVHSWDSWVAFHCAQCKSAAYCCEACQVPYPHTSDMLL
jgi:hypothetical protein